jgi:hypothetical protein
MTRSIIPLTCSTIVPRISILGVFPMSSPSAIPPARFTAINSLQRTILAATLLN